MKKTIYLVIFSLFLVGCLPDEIDSNLGSWKYGQPHNFQFSKKKLMVIDSTLKEGLYDTIVSLIVMKDNNIIFENYYRCCQKFSTKRNELIPLSNGTILVSQLGLALALKQKIIKSINDPIFTYLPEYATIFESDELKKSITFKNLITHNSGLVSNENILDYSMPENDFNRIRTTEDWTKEVLNQPMDVAPDFRISYNSASAMVISKIVQNLTNQSLEEYIQKNIFQPLGIKRWKWDKDPSGVTDAMSGLYLTMIDYMKIANFYLNNGNINNKYIVDGTFMLESKQTYKEYNEIYNYGYYWWLFSNSFNFQKNLEKNDVFYFPNNFNTHIYVIPHKNIIIAIASENKDTYFYNPTLFLYLEILKAILN